ncbi:hypothetical protein GJ496_001851 [Pomphorhynchus laevis]|nr:hypothetical protein GJ496_001851 [Pomphorhynchus laevis]
MLCHMIALNRNKAKYDQSESVTLHIGKLILTKRDNILEARGTIQLYVSLKKYIGFEIKSLKEAYNSNSELFLLAVDAKHSFNRINRSANIQYVCTE